MNHILEHRKGSSWGVALHRRVHEFVCCRNVVLVGNKKEDFLGIDQKLFLVETKWDGTLGPQDGALLVPLVVATVVLVVVVDVLVRQGQS
jgi:hypothetical protein